MRRRRTASKREPTIALINIVFLMLVFFMVAGTLAPPLDGEVKLVETDDLEGEAPPDALVVHADGRLSYRGEDMASPEAYLARLSEDDDAEGPLRIVPDRALPAAELVRLAAALRAGGSRRVTVVTERGLE